jgi:hypothetical protein
MVGHLCPGCLWQAIALWGKQEALTADSADGLLYKVRRHYPGLLDSSVAISK